MPLSEGTKLGRYEIRAEIGAGGMGHVYMAQDTSELNRTVAIKLLPAEVAADPKWMQRFIREARTVSNLNHPNVLTIYEFGVHDSTRFLAMEYVDGVTLREHLNSNRLNLHEVLDIGIQIAAALSAAHDAHVIHRDIKPENIMLRRRSAQDFGPSWPGFAFYIVATGAPRARASLGDAGRHGPGAQVVSGFLYALERCGSGHPDLD